MTILLPFQIPDVFCLDKVHGIQAADHDAELNKMDGAYTPQKMEVDAGENFITLLSSLPFEPPVKQG